MQHADVVRAVRANRNELYRAAADVTAEYAGQQKTVVITDPALTFLGGVLMSPHDGSVYANAPDVYAKAKDVFGIVLSEKTWEPSDVVTIGIDDITIAYLTLPYPFGKIKHGGR